MVKRTQYVNKISTHTLTWSVTCLKMWQVLTLHFNSHAHVERDSIIPFIGFSPINFNSHAHVERDKEWNTEKKDISDFNSHAHVERDPVGLLAPICTKISTHTLTWSVTRYLPFYPMLSDISTHTLTWSVTHSVLVHTMQIIISTHTLTWSVTCNNSSLTKFSVNFNSHAHVERDVGRNDVRSVCENFNSHAHVERDGA